MTDTPNSMFDGPPGRPDHPDFFKLSSIVLGLDASIDPQTMTEDEMEAAFVARMEALNIDRASVAYMATQRAFRVLGITDPRQMLINPDLMQRAAQVGGAWLDAFAAGAMYERGLR